MSHALMQQITACRVCRDSPNYQPALPHEPRPVCVATRTARILVAGQAPGKRVHASGIPFDDPSGDRLREWMGISPDVFYDKQKIAIVPMGFCFPGLDSNGGDLPPRRECRTLWRSKVMKILSNVRLTLVIGQYAHAYHLGAQRGPTVTETVANWRRFHQPGAGKLVFPLPHPSWRNNAWLKKNLWFEEELLPELRKAVGRLVV